jgi:hypothetical protein
VIFWVLLSFVLFVLLMVQTFRAHERGVTIEEIGWDHLFERERDLKEDWRYRADAANHHKKHWRQRARQQKHIIEHLERERHELNNQLHWMSLVYERLVDTIYRGRRPGQVIPLDLPPDKKRAPTPGIPARRPLS